MNKVVLCFVFLCIPLVAMENPKLSNSTEIKKYPPGYDIPSLVTLCTKQSTQSLIDVTSKNWDKVLVDWHKLPEELQTTISNELFFHVVDPTFEKDSNFICLTREDFVHNNEPYANYEKIVFSGDGTKLLVYHVKVGSMHTCYVYDLQKKELLYKNSHTYAPQKAYLNYDGSYMTHFKRGSEQKQTVIITNLKTKKTDEIKFVDRIVESDGINLISVYKDGNDNKVEIQPIKDSNKKTAFTIPCSEYGTIKKITMGQGFITCLAKQANNTILFSQDLNDTNNIHTHQIFNGKSPDNFPLLQVSPRGSKTIVQIRQAAGTVLDIHDLKNQTTHSINLKESFTEKQIKPLDEQKIVLFNKNAITLLDIETQTRKTIPIPCEFNEFKKHRLVTVHAHNSLQLVSSFIPNIYQFDSQAICVYTPAPTKILLLQFLLKNSPIITSAAIIKKALDQSEFFQLHTVEQEKIRSSIWKKIGDWSTDDQSEQTDAESQKNLLGLLCHQWLYKLPKEIASIEYGDDTFIRNETKRELFHFFGKKTTDELKPLKMHRSLILFKALSALATKATKPTASQEKQLKRLKNTYL